MKSEPVHCSAAGSGFSCPRKGVFCRVAAAVAASAAVLLLPGCVVDHFLFQPPGSAAAARTVPAEGSRRLTVEPGVEIAFRHLPAPPGGETILYSHGNAEDLGSMRYLPGIFAANGYGVMVYDYEGYGGSDGSPSEENCCRDIEAAYRYLTETRGIPPEQIVIYGFSLGTGPSCRLAEQVEAKALVLEAPFTSVLDVAGMGWLPFDRFPNLKRIGNVKMPVLILYGDRDRVVPPEHGAALYEAANPPKARYVVPGAGHNNLRMVAGQEFWKNLRLFLDGQGRAARNAEEK